MKYVNLYLTNAKLYSMSLTNTPPTSSNDINLTEITKTGEYYTLTATSNPQSFFIVPNAEINKIAPLNLDGPFEQLQMNTDKYYSDLNGFPLGLNPTTDTEGTEVDYITVNILEEDTDYLNKRGLKVFYDALQEKNLKLNFKESLDHEIEKNSINIYDNYITKVSIKERENYLSDNPDMILSSKLAFDPGNPELDLTWEEWIARINEEYSETTFTYNDFNNYIGNWVSQLTIEEWNNIYNMYTEGNYDVLNNQSTANLMFTINNKQYDFNYILTCITIPNDGSTIKGIVVALPLGENWYTCIIELADNELSTHTLGQWSSGSVIYAEISELNVTIDDRIAFLSNGHQTTFSNTITTWEKNIYSYFVIGQWIIANVQQVQSWNSFLAINNNEVPKAYPEKNFVGTNNRNLNWVFDISLVTLNNESRYIPTGLFLINEDFYYAYYEADMRKYIISSKFKVSETITEQKQNIVIFSDGNNNTKEYNLNGLQPTTWGENSWNNGTVKLIDNFGDFSIITNYSNEEIIAEDVYNEIQTAYNNGIFAGFNPIYSREDFIKFCASDSMYANLILAINTFESFSTTNKFIVDGVDLSFIYNLAEIPTSNPNYYRHIYTTIVFCDGEHTYLASLFFEWSYEAGIFSRLLNIKTSNSYLQFNNSQKGTKVNTEKDVLARTGDRMSGTLIIGPGFSNNNYFDSCSLVVGKNIAADGQYSVAFGRDATSAETNLVLSGSANTIQYEVAQNYVDSVPSECEGYFIKNSSNDTCARIVSWDSTNRILTTTNTLSGEELNNKTVSLMRLSGTAGSYSFSHGRGCLASGDFSHAEGYDTIAGSGSHAEGYGCEAFGGQAHAEGHYSNADGIFTHAEGEHTKAEASNSHTEGSYTASYGAGSHAEGAGNASEFSQKYIYLTGSKNATSYTVVIPSYRTETINSYSVGDLIIGRTDATTNYWATITAINTSNSTITVDKTLSSKKAISSLQFTTINKQANTYGQYSHTEGNFTQAWNRSQHAAGEFNIPDITATPTTRGTYAEIIGNGTADNARSNAATIAWNGEAWFSGDVYTGSTSGTNKDSGSKKLATEDYVTTRGYTTNTGTITGVSVNGTSVATSGVANITSIPASILTGTVPSNCYTDTKNTTGSTDTSSKIYLVGAIEQSANPQTYSQDTAYVGTDGKLYSNSKEVVNLSDTQALTNKTYNGYTLAAACAKAVVTSIDTSASLPTSGAVKTFVEGKGYVTTDTKNTAGSTDTSNKIYLVGATSQTASSQTYSDDEVYTTSGTLTAKEFSLGTNAKIVYNTSESCIEFNFS